jgi:large subunit ribosomal protein L30
MILTRALIRGLATAASTSESASSQHNTHFRITLRRSAIGLPKSSKRTLEALGIHRKGATVFQAHSPEAAGKILRVKELVEVQNVPADAVKTKTEMRVERKAVRGYRVISRWNPAAS